MNLYQVAPECLTIGGIDYPIDTDFRAWIKFQSILSSKQTDNAKAEALCDLMAEWGLPLTRESLNAMVTFYKATSNEHITGGGKSVKAFDFDQDSEYIYSAFLESYGIDLSQARIHWWKFKALFKALPENCQFCKIMYYRTVDIDKVPKSQRKYYSEMKQRYALTVSGKKKTLRETVEELKQKQNERKQNNSEE